MMFLSRHEKDYKMKQIWLAILLVFAIPLKGETQTHHINFSDVPAIEFIAWSVLGQLSEIYSKRVLALPYFSDEQ